MTLPSVKPFKSSKTDFTLYSRISITPTEDYLEYYTTSDGVYNLLRRLFKNKHPLISTVTGSCSVKLDFTQIKGFNIPTLTINLRITVNQDNKFILEHIEEILDSQTPIECGYLSDVIILGTENLKIKELWYRSFETMDTLDMNMVIVNTILQKQDIRRLNTLVDGFLFICWVQELFTLDTTDMKILLEEQWGGN